MTEQADTSVPWLRVSVVILALNEARNLPHLFARSPPDVHEVILVDGLSVDDTIAVATDTRCEQPQRSPGWPPGFADHPGRVAPLHRTRALAGVTAPLARLAP